MNDPRASGGGVGFLVIGEPNEDSVVEFDDFRLYVPQNRSKVTFGRQHGGVRAFIGFVKNDWPFFPFRKLNGAA